MSHRLNVFVCLMSIDMSAVHSIHSISFSDSLNAIVHPVCPLRFSPCLIATSTDCMNVSLSHCLNVSTSESLNVSSSHRLNVYVHCRRPCMALRAPVSVARPSTCTPLRALAPLVAASSSCAVDIRDAPPSRSTCPFRPQVWAHRTINQPMLPSLRSWRTPCRGCPGCRNGNRARAGHAQPASPRARACEGDPVRQRTGLHAACALHRGCDGAKVRRTLASYALHKPSAELSVLLIRERAGRYRF